MNEAPAVAQDKTSGFIRGLGLLDSTMIVSGSMIGSGVFIVSADIARNVGSAGWLLLVWIVTGLLTIAAALSYGELAGMMPNAGGQYIYLREAYSPLWGFLYGWTLFWVIQTGTIAAVAVAFARFLGILVPGVSPNIWIVRPINVSSGYAVSLTSQQLVAILLILVLTGFNTRGLQWGKVIQNVFTSAKTLSLLALVLIGIVLGRNQAAITSNFNDPWTPRQVLTIKPDLAFLPVAAATSGALGLFVAFCVAQVGSLFSADAWNNITFTAGEVREPQRNIPLSLFFGTVLVISLYVLANVAYLVTLPLADIQNAPDNGARQFVFEICGESQCKTRPGSGSYSPGDLGSRTRVAADAAACSGRSTAPRSRHRRGAIRQSVRQFVGLRGLCGSHILCPHHRRSLHPPPHEAGCRQTVSRVRIPLDPGFLHRRRDSHHGRADPLQDANHLARIAYRFFRHSVLSRMAPGLSAVMMIFRPMENSS